MLLKSGAKANNMSGVQLLMDIVNEMNAIKSREIQRILKGTNDLEDEYIQIIKLLVQQGTIIDKEAKIKIQHESSNSEWSDEEDKKEDEQNIITYIHKEGYILLARYLAELK